MRCDEVGGTRFQKVVDPRARQQIIPPRSALKEVPEGDGACEMSTQSLAGYPDERLESRRCGGRTEAGKPKITENDACVCAHVCGDSL